MEWGAPGPAERDFDLAAYVGRLEAALGHAAAVTGAPVALAGYCMGGNLALAAALSKPSQVRALALLATPWDFHADRPELARAVSASSESLLEIAARFGGLPTDVLQSLFYLLDPYLAPRKFLRFAEMEPGSARALAFVALEDWLNDGVPLAAGAARDCLLGWYGRNEPGRGEWRVGGRVVDPGRVTMPTLVMLPAQDRIVPPLSAAALGAAIPQADVRRPAAGHIGMIVSGVARHEVWEPLRDWLRAQAAAPFARRPTRRSKKPVRKARTAQ
jgi:polyhydroxyalkanoate synthase